MAFANKIGSLLKHVVSSKPSIYQAVRLMSSSKLFVGGLSYSTDDQSLREVFSGYGEVLEARVIIDRETGRSRGFGFITFSSGEEASAAVTAMDGKDLHGRMVRVNYATDRRSGFGGGGGYGGGGYGGGGYGGGDGGGYGGGGYGGGGGNYNSGGYGGGDGAGYGGGGGFGGGSGGGNYVAGGVGGSESFASGTLGQNQGSSSTGFAGGSEQFNFNLNKNNQFGSTQENLDDNTLKDDFDLPDDYANKRA
ncbi:hypothetical protein KFK09_004558 [Dendrobium nobile]|uniref:RRM domain-containing protein n=1 Tax=Dendrobium nobile TaxID=94219 RepID=A0A8T3C0S5_DENNO|nr:hypothetical protein KFK09_004558 [Dendrobium nobile]